MTEPIPTRLNLALLAMAMPLTWGLLWVGTHGVWGWRLVAAFLFAFAAHLPFSLLHEAVHGIFSPHRFVNEGAGVLAGAMFPTSFSLQRIAHLGHHQRNRTDAELYDYHLPHQSRILRALWLYAGNLMGIYWFMIPLNTLVYLVAPSLVMSRWFAEGPANVLGFGPYVSDLASGPKLRMWGECLGAVAYQVGLAWALKLSWQGWFLCHGAFALHWSALQYVDHAWSARDVIHGAWNLKVFPPVRWFALNYHLHLAHHRHPQLPWIHLPAAVRPEDPRPTFWEIYRSLWRGTRPAPPMGSPSLFRPGAGG